MRLSPSLVAKRLLKATSAVLSAVDISIETDKDVYQPGGGTATPQGRRGEAAHNGPYPTFGYAMNQLCKIRKRFGIALIVLVFLGGCGGGGSPEIALRSPSPSPSRTGEPSPGPTGVGSLSPTPTATASSPRPGPAARPRPPSAPKPPPPAPPAKPPAAPEFPPASQACEENIERVSSLGAMGSSCETARRVAAAFDAKVMAGGAFPGREPLLVDDGWSCRATSSGGDMGEVFSEVCTKGNESITFEWGV